MDKSLKTRFFAAADRALAVGRYPALDDLQEQSRVDDRVQAEALLAEWRRGLSNRLGTATVASSSGEVPDSVQGSMQRLWQLALEEATERVTQIQLLQEQPAESAAEACSVALRESRCEMHELEKRFGELQRRYEMMEERCSGLEGQCKELQQTLVQERTERQKAEQLHANVCQELAQLHKTYEDAKKVFDQRIKDEKRYALEAVAKAEVDTRHYRNALEKLRDESGKNEAALSRELRASQEGLARRDGKVDTLSNQIRLLDDELKRLKSEDAQQSKEQASLSAQLLAERNRVKRYETQLAELEQGRDKLNLKLDALVTESSRREQQLRAQLQSSEESMLKLRGSATGMEDRIAALEEENRRLKARR